MRCVHNTPLWQNIMTSTRGLKITRPLFKRNMLLHIYISEERQQTCRKFPPTPLMVHLSSRYISFSWKSTVHRPFHKNFFVAIVMRQWIQSFIFASYFFSRPRYLSRYSDSPRDGRFGVGTPGAAKFCVPFQTGTEVRPDSCAGGIGVKRPESGVDHPPHLVPRLKKV
jgi:hypothetical protein